MTGRDRSDGGDQGSLSETLYEELKALAARHMRHERADHTLQPTALVHEAWLRLAERADGKSLDEQGFRALAARTLRRVLIDHGRARQTEKRGGGRRTEPLDEDVAEAAVPPPSLVDLEEALGRLGERSPRQAQVVELHFVGGLSLAEVARALDVGLDSVKRDWRFARAWLNRELERGGNA
jgi:RNA polymerase sigma factor (TIGR02999 family)